MENLDVIQPENKNLKIDTHSTVNTKELSYNHRELNQENKCKKHSMPLVYYAVGTNLFFCDKCLPETNLKTYPIPGIIKDIKRKIDNSQLKVCLLKNEINRLGDFFDSYM